MALCVALAADGTLAPTGQALADCTGYVLASPADVWLADILAQAFNAPTPEVFAAWWFGCFALPITCYLAAKAVGAVINSISDR